MILVPVAILIDGRFYDAGAYKADPVPMALERGTVYEAEKAGDSQGLFTINGALHSTGINSAHRWMGSGTFLPQGTESVKTSHKAENRPLGMDDSGDEPPRLTRNAAPKAAASPDAGSAPNGSNPGGSAGSPEKPDAKTAPAGDKPAGKDDKPAGKDNKPQPDASPGSTASGESSGDYYRPTLRRGKPTGPAPADDDNSKPADVTKAPASATPATATSAVAGNERVLAAISDAAGPEPQSYKYFWKTGEEDERRNQMLELARNEVRKYVEMRAKGVISATPAPKATAAGRKAPAKQSQPVIENVQFFGYDVWLTNQPVMVLSAEGHIPTAAGAAGAATAETYSITLVARTDIYGSLLKVYSGVTDRFHLDVTPRLELIDVVDADGDGRGELLFRETSDSGSGYVIYRATADKLWKMFDSLAAE